MTMRNRAGTRDAATSMESKKGEFVRIPAVFMRGGTSKGVYLMAEDLPSDPELRDRVILDIYGSPDARQINGMGGADPLTSKVAVLSVSEREGVDKIGRAHV